MTLYMLDVTEVIDDARAPISAAAADFNSLLTPFSGFSPGQSLLCNAITSVRPVDVVARPQRGQRRVSRRPRRGLLLTFLALPSLLQAL